MYSQDALLMLYKNYPSNVPIAAMGDLRLAMVNDGQDLEGFYDFLLKRCPKTPQEALVFIHEVRRAPAPVQARAVFLLKDAERTFAH